MQLPLSALIQDPPPLLVFELSADGLTAVRRDARSGEIEARAEAPLEPGVIDPSPTKPNVADAQALGVALASVLEQLGPVKRNETALLLPDASSRLTVLDFEQLPAGAEERLAVIRARLVKAVPFDIAAARLSYQISRVGSAYSALVAVTPAEVVRQYEDALARVGLWPGFVSLSMAAALNLTPAGGMRLFAKLSGRAMTMAAVDGDAVRLIRTVELGDVANREPDRVMADMLADIFPTQVYIADNLGAPVEKLLLCGFGELLQPALELFPHELGCDVEPLRSPEGPVGRRDAGIWGYLSLS